MNTFPSSSWPFICLLLRRVYSDPLLIFLLGYLIVFNWVVWVPYILDRYMVYQIYGLQRFSPTSFSHLRCAPAVLNHKTSLLKTNTSHNIIMLFLMAETIIHPHFLFSVVLLFMLPNTYQLFLLSEVFPHSSKRAYHAFLCIATELLLHTSQWSVFFVCCSWDLSHVFFICVP